jgi:hypothetical protein
MKVVLLGNEVTLEDYEVLVRSTKERKIIASIVEEGVFSIEFDEVDTHRFLDTVSSALKILSTITPSTISPADIDLHKVTLGPSGCQH